MAGPLNGIGGQQQVPLSQPFQPGQDSNQVRNNPEQQPADNQVQPQGAPAAGTQNTETDDQDVLQQQIKELITGSSAENGLSADDAPRRGSLVDVTV